MSIADHFFDTLQIALLEEWRKHQHDPSVVMLSPYAYVIIRVEEIANELALLKRGDLNKLLKHKHAFRVELPTNIKAGEPMYSSTGHNQVD